MKQIISDKLKTNIYGTRAEMGKGAADDIAICINALLKAKDEINMIFAAAPSQNEVLASLVADKSIDWTRINAYHMDEYVGLSIEKEQSFARYLSDHVFSKAPFAISNSLETS